MNALYFVGDIPPGECRAALALTRRSAFEDQPSTELCKRGKTMAAKQPNIVAIMADDIGIWNIGAYHRGMTGGPHSEP